MKKVVFIDRDGVINVDSPDYIKNCDEFEFLPGSLEAFKLLKEVGYEVIVITNQSVIGRNMVTPEGLNAIFSKMTTGVKSAGGEIKDIFFCPHTPDDHCQCRKPLPGMILAAQKKYGIELQASCMIGDSAKDVECSKNAGCGLSVLVKTGNGLKAAKELERKKIEPGYIAENLLDAVKWIINKNM